MYKLLLALITTASLMSCTPSNESSTLGEAPVPVPAPFEDLDTLATNDWWNRGSNPIIEMKVARNEVVAFGMYTVSNGTLKLSAQLYPLYPEETREVRLEVDKGNGWEEIQTQEVNDLGWSALFRVENWDHSRDIPYRLRHGKEASFEGLIRKDPGEKGGNCTSRLLLQQQQRPGRPSQLRAQCQPPQS